uniref:Reverse transcriptase domain-containing protein n=1 Tax=Tanacetum cinerariifolium TaxID=118510 RepID=A0A6L2LIB1_TANCI|nr:reverse transcriptase domain-containing protein [Tanacetum cinerariifolium]
MVDQRTMAELLRAPTERYAEAIVVPPILVDQFELKHSLINMMTTNQFFGLEKDNPHDHIRWFNKITSTIKYKDVPNSTIKLILFLFSLAGAARRWLEKEPPRSIHTWEDLVSKFINEFFPPSRTTNLRNEILNFQQRFDESFHEALDRYKDLLRACPHHGFTELHQLDTFYNTLNPADQDSLNATADEIDKLTHAVNQQTSVVTTAMTAILKQFQATPPPASVKAVEEICVTCGGAHPYYQCLAADGNTFPELRDNIQGYVSAAAINYNQGLPELISTRMTLELANRAICTPAGITRDVFISVGNFTFPADFVIVDYETITTRSGIVLDGPTVPTTITNPEVDERVEETLTDSNLAEYTIKKLPEKLGDPGKFLIPCGFSEFKCKALADLGLPELISTYMTFELANRAIFTPARIVRDVFVPVGKFTFQADFVIVDYESCTTYSSSPLLEELFDEPALITFPLKYDDDLQFDVKSDLKEIEFLLHKDIDSNLKDSIDQSNLANLADIFIDSMPEMFADEHALDYSSPPIFDEYDDDFLEVESNTENVYDDPFDSNGEKIKESKLLIDELDLLVIFFLPSMTHLSLRIFPGTRVVQDKKLAISNAYLVLEDFDPPLYEPIFFKEVPMSNMLLLFSSENDEKVFKPGIHTSEKVHSSFILELSHQGYKIFKINQIFKSPMKIFLFSCGKDTDFLAVPCLYFYPLN